MSTTPPDVDRQLDALLAGTIDPHDLRALEARAAEDAQIRDALEAYRPIRPQSRDHIVHQAVREVRNASRRRLLARTGAALGGLAAAAATILFFTVDRAPPLPQYTLSFEGGEKAFRGAAGGGAEAPDAPRLMPDSLLRVVLRPTVPVDGDAGVALFTERDGATLPLRAPVERSPQGAFKLEGSARELFGDLRGDVELLFVVGRPDDLPGDGCQTLRLKLSLVES